MQQSVQKSKMNADKKRKSTFEDDSYRPEKKSPRYIDHYLDFGLTFILQNGEEKPQCVISSKVLASESMLPNKLKRHLGKSHPQLSRVELRLKGCCVIVARWC